MRIRILLIFVGALLVVATFTFPSWRSFFIDDTLVDPFPGLPSHLQEDFALLTPAEQTAFMQLLAEDPPTALAIVTAALQAPTIVNNPEDNELPANAGSRLTSGNFRRISPIFWAQGSASIYQMPDSSKILRFEDFQSANGPNLHVYLSASDAPEKREDVELGNLHLDLGPLTGNIGNQNYIIPTEVDLSLYNSVVIYAPDYHIIFSTATI